MSFDLNQFFKEATLRVCGSLEAEEFLEDAFNYLVKFVPVEFMVLSYYDPTEGKQTLLAEASIKGGRLLKQSLVQPGRIKSYSSRPGLDFQVIEKAKNHPTAQPWITAGRLDPEASLLVMRLFARPDMIGTVIMVAQKGETFNQKQQNLVRMLQKPFAIALANCARYQELMELKELLRQDYRDLQQDYIHSGGRRIIGVRFGLKGVMDMVRQVAPLNSPVLLLGESGTGKELIAAAIHQLSTRREGPFVKVNCGAIPESLVDSELFGHEKGAFTGALAKKRGRFERAHKGTIFLDEIGELKPDLQVRLLRVLQEKEIEPVGAAEPVKVDVRVIAATHRNLEQMVKEGEFRQDLFFRLKVFPIEIPPLRDRKNDIPSLVEHFILAKHRELGHAVRPEPEPGSLDLLMGHDWPGNVRELENTVERALILSRGNQVSFRGLGLLMGSGGVRLPVYVSQDPPDQALPPLEQVIKGHIQKALYQCRGQVGGPQGAARALMMNPSTLRKKMRKLGIVFGREAAGLYQKRPGNSSHQNKPADDPLY